MIRRPPVAKVSPHRSTVHGATRVDPYHWLRDLDTDPDVRTYLDAENEYAEQALQGAGDLRQALYEELQARVRLDDRMVPGRRGDYFYYLRTEAERPHRIHCRRRGDPERGEEEVLLDLNEIALEHGYVDTAQVRISPDDRFIAYGLDLKGDESYALYVKDLQTGEVIGDPIPHIGGMLAWASDGRTVLYNQRDHTGRPCRVRRHDVGRTAADVTVAEEGDVRFSLLINRSLSGRYVFLNYRSRSTREVRMLSAEQPSDRPRVIAPRQPGLRSFAVHHGDRFFIMTNLDAPNFRVVETPVDASGPECWADVVAHSEDVCVDRLDVFRRHLVVSQRDRGLPTVLMQNLDSGARRTLRFDEATYALTLKGNLDFETDTLRVHYSSPKTPTSVFDVDLDSGVRRLRKRDEVRGGYDPDRYVVDRIWAESTDGVRVPISLLYRSDVRLDGSAPCVLVGYGAYGSKADMSFQPDRFSLVDRGVICATAHVRGGGELGPRWWDAGRLVNKTCSFADFVACAEHLIADGYTAADRLVAEGGSAGGLLVGAVLNMRPELFVGAVASVPFVDVTNTMLDPGLRMTSTEYEEWGDPRVADAYAYIDSYSPYDNVRARSYPHMLVTNGLHDTRVHFWGPAKWVARLRASRTDDNLLLLRTRMASGHFGPSGRDELRRETAFGQAFVLKVLLGGPR